MAGWHPSTTLVCSVMLASAGVAIAAEGPVPRDLGAPLSDGGSLDFAMTNVRNQVREFVTVRAHGSMVSEQGDSVPFDLTLVCEPGGT